MESLLLLHLLPMRVHMQSNNGHINQSRTDTAAESTPQSAKE